MKRPSIPAITIDDKKIAAILRPMKENIEVLGGNRGDSLAHYSMSYDPPVPSDKLKTLVGDSLYLAQKINEVYSVLAEIHKSLDKVIARLSP